ncbi:histidine biosynthesis trifunctional-protein [Neolentinus lepideus HHB14362 ss-1]|uniref:Histidine biosynthesis trifunctional protein n=1 Tax=Neolentinus lepideus HHB14362 ss-1 TaxID=1314782 RepID=A0A165P143_9AGAM|nr:histidine biosynthesis trifunctional-protein [Neolentinus lepideus HHB14362 ss-1]
MSVFLPLLESAADSALVDALGRIGPVIVPSLVQVPVSDTCGRYILFDHDSSFDLDKVVDFLDGGAEKVIIPVSWAKEIAGTLPADRILLLLDVANVSAVTDKIREGVSGVLIKTPALDLDLISSVMRFFSDSSVYVLPTTLESPSQSTIRKILGAKAALVLPTSQLTLGASTKDQINVGEAFVSALTSDRRDGLFATVVSSYPQGGKSLGLVYSSVESIKESIVTGKGVYQSRKHGLWRKGETSGATQDVVHIFLDCDSDAIEFSVIQHGSGFCHLNRLSCFDDLYGLSALERTLQSRLSSAPEDSYTKRLFNDQSLLRSKIMEEADELCHAETKEDVAFEAADLLYFAMTRCVAAGVSLADIERSLDKKAKKVTRRPGNAKPQFAPKAAQPTSVYSVAAPAANGKPNGADNDFIRMRTFDLSVISKVERSQLLRRPVLKSDEMISKVKPIVDEVRDRGDTALLEFTAKFDKVNLSSPVLHTPFPDETTQIEENVRQAIDKAYANIRKFHEAQAENSTLKVETMPGVVCSRFARPIARVGLYVPGGTAILPSTALMLGVPAQVAGCQEIVIATPPKSDGSVSAEVMYVAKLVGASTVLKAGGGQAVAAMAYGTQTVPKVDKIFGPGNQWVTAAKMLVQNDTDALVSIDMPAGPSEVLVIADSTSNPDFVAADLLSQAEHGIDSQVVLVAVNLTSSELDAVEKAVDLQAKALSRVDIVRQSVAKSIIVKTSSVEEAVKFSNDYAPEHLILHLKEASQAVSLVQNAGSVFVGPYSPESCGDYASGTNHTLPTNGYARQFSGVNTLSFQKHITSQEVSADGLKVLGPIVATLADCEGLDAHANAVRIRLRQILN